MSSKTDSPQNIIKTAMQKSISAELSNYLHRWKDDKDPFGVWSMMWRAIEPVVLQEVLEHTKGNKSRAAQILGINRGSLSNKLRSYGMNQWSTKPRPKRR